jgi:hypothetical protein
MAPKVKFGTLTATQTIANVQALEVKPGNKNVQTFRNPTDVAADKVCFNHTTESNKTVFQGNPVVLAQLQQYAAQGNPPVGPSFSKSAKITLGNLFGPKEEIESTMCLANAC